MTSNPSPAHRFCVAPMMDWTDRHCRYFLRQITRHTLLYTEMVTTGALLHGDAPRFLRFDAQEHPLALQLGGSKPGDLARCARMAQAEGYDEVNLNVGCPSDRVQNGRIGACLMAEPALVADCVAAMRDAVDIPVTVKCRIGIDGRDSYAQLLDFVGRSAEAGCERFVVHARIAILQGLSPKENREVPPLDYERVCRLKADLPQLAIVLNGGIRSLDEAEAHLRRVDGVMLGREAYQNPFVLAGVDRRFFGAQAEPPTRDAVLEGMFPYIERERRAGVPVKHIARHLLGLYQGCPGGKRFRRHLSEQVHKADAGLEVLRDAMALVAA